MKKTIRTGVLATLCLIFGTNAQGQTQPKALKVGDQVPDIPLNNLTNYRTAAGKPAQSARLSDFSGKLLILDFWATWCGSCIKEFPHVEALAGKYKGRVQFLLVNSKPITRDDRAKIGYFFSYHAKPKNVGLVAEDTTLCQFFTLAALPRYIWLSGDRTVLAMTDQTAVTESNIRRMLDSGAISPPNNNKTSEP